MEQNNAFSSGQNTGDRGDQWYVDNYILLKDYYDRTISRIAARCVRQGNIAMEEYPFYGYVLDVLEEISETGDYIMAHPALYPYLEKKMAGGINALKKNLNEFKTELKNNASPDMIKQDQDELKRMKEALGAMDKSTDPTIGAGMSMDEVVEKLMNKQQPVNNQQQQHNQRPQGQQPNRLQQQRPQGGNPQQQRQPQQQGQPHQGQNPGQPRPNQGQNPRPQGKGQPQPNRPQQVQQKNQNLSRPQQQGQRSGHPNGQKRPQNQPGDTNRQQPLFNKGQN